MRMHAVALTILTLASPALASQFDPMLGADLAFRDLLPQTEIAPERWGTCCGKYGPLPLTYPRVQVPDGSDPVEWQQQRVLAVARRYIGLPYKHRHIPAMGGLDCSNFTSWVYNYGLGIHFDSNAQRQSRIVGRKLARHEDLKPGDLIYIWNTKRTRISHVVIYVNPYWIIDSTGPGVAERPFRGWYRYRYAWARRVIE